MRRLLAKVVRLLHVSKQRMRRRFTPLGRLLLWGTLMSAILAPNPEIDTLHYLTLFAALLVVGLIGAHIQRVQLVAVRNLPRYCTVGQPLHYRINVTNTGRRTITGITAMDELERCYPVVFLGYSRWRGSLLLNRGGSINMAEQCIRLEPGAVNDIDLELLPHRRGWLHFKHLYLLLPDPLGLCNRCITFTLSSTILSLPQRYPVGPIGGTGSTGRRYPLSKSGPSQDFLYLRDYRCGDPMQRIHWRGYARHGDLLVREYEHPDAPRLGLLLDTCTNKETGRKFEAAISIAASLLTAEPERNEWPMPSVLVIGSQVLMRVPQLPNTAGKKKMLEHVACASAEPSANLPRFSATARSMTAYLGFETLIIVFLDWNEPRQALCEDLRRAGHKLLILVVTQQNSLVTEDITPTPGGPVYMHIDHLKQTLARPLCTA